MDRIAKSVILNCLVVIIGLFLGCTSDDVVMPQAQSAMSAIMGIAQTNITFTQVLQFDTKVYDTRGELDTQTYAFIPLASGLYVIHAQVLWSNPVKGEVKILSIFLNGHSAGSNMLTINKTSDILSHSITRVVALNAGDAVTIHGTSLFGGGDVNNNANVTYLQIAQIY